MDLVNQVTNQDIEKLWNPQDLPGTESAFRALLPRLQQLTGRDRCHSILLMSWIARAEAEQSRYADSRETLAQAGRLLEEDAGIYPVATKIRWLIERGRLHLLEKTPSQARNFFAEAWTLAINSAEDCAAIEIAQLMATSEPPKAQQAWIVRAIEIAEKSGLPGAKQMIGGLYAALGWKFHELRQFERSLEFFKKALELLKLHGPEREIFPVQWSIGKVLRTMGRTEEALNIQKTLLAELGIGGRRDGRLYEELAECLQTLNRPDEAQLYFELAYREFSDDEWVSDNQPLRLKRMKDLGKVK